MNLLHHPTGIVLNDIPIAIDLAALVEAPIPVTTTVICLWVANQFLALSTNLVWEIADFSWFFALTDLLVAHHILGHPETMAHDSRIAICLDPMLRTLTLVPPPPIHPDRPTIDRATVRTIGIHLPPSDLEQTIHALQSGMEQPHDSLDDVSIDLGALGDSHVADAFLRWCQQWCQAQAHEN